MATIQINLLRISPGSDYIEFSVEAPINYRFNTLNIKKYDYLTTTGYPTNSSGFVDASSVYKKTSTKEIIRIATSIFGGSTLFYVEFGVRWIGTGLEPLNSDGTKLSDTTSVGVCSDINNFYKYLATPFLNLECECLNLNNDAKRCFAVLFAHQEAMRLERFEEAEKFYTILKNNFNTCTTSTRYTNTQSCGCNG